MEVIKPDCGLCVDSCGIDAYVENGRMVKVEGMKEHPASKVYLCPKGQRLVEYVYSPDRLLNPKIKDSNGNWHNASLNEALDLCSTKLSDINRRRIE